MTGLAWRAIALTLAGIAIPASPGGASVASGERPPVRHVDAPLGRISCDELSYKTPNAIEARDDERDRPYFALVRVWSFPDLAPLDVALDRIGVRGASEAARVGPGEYYFSRIALGFTALSLLAENDAGVARGAGPGRRAIAGRNPLVLARHAITVCDVYVPDESRLDARTEFRGIVVDRVTGLPLNGAAVVCESQTVRTDADGKFSFPESVTWRALLQSTTMVGAEGYRQFRMSSLGLSAQWVERLIRQGEAVCTLSRDEEEKASALLPPLLK